MISFFKKLITRPKCDRCLSFLTVHELLTSLKREKKKKRLKLRRGKRPKQTLPQTLFVAPVLERYGVIFPYLFIPLHFALSAIMQAPTRKVTLNYSKQVWSNILIKIHVVFKKKWKRKAQIFVQGPLKCTDHSAILSLASSLLGKVLPIVWWIPILTVLSSPKVEDKYNNNNNIDNNNTMVEEW